MRRGLTLLEVLVALLILSLVVAGYLELFHGSHVLLARSRMWSQAIAYAADGMEQVKVGAEPVTYLPGGFRRQVTSRPWSAGLQLITVTVILPNGARFNLERLHE
jgi:prepilin-type N-terminal cleavage/methylation domain-containing protein